jgi:hypothetical protein
MCKGFRWTLMMVLFLGGGLDRLARSPTAAEIELLDVAPTRSPESALKFRVKGSLVKNRATQEWEGDQMLWVVACGANDADAITGWYLQLRQNQLAGVIRNGGHLNGVVLQNESSVTYLTQLNTKVRHAPFLQNWSATLELKYGFGLAQNNAFALSMAEGFAKSIDSIKVSSRGVGIRVFVDWFADTRELTVEVTDLDDPLDSGVQYLTGRYFVTARSVTSTLSSKQDLSLSYSMTAEPKKDPADSSEPAPTPKQTISVSGSSYKESTKKRMMVITDGCAYELNYGKFAWIEYGRADGSRQVEISLGAEFVTAIELSVRQTLQQKSAMCDGQRSMTGSLTFTDKITDASGTLSNEVKCGVESTAVPYDVMFTIAPTLDRNKTLSEQQEGMKAQCRWCIDTGSKSGWYQPAYRNGLTYKLSATAANGISSASILVKSDATDTRVTRKKYLPVTWK